MKAVLQMIRILVTTLLIVTVCCQDGFQRDLLRLHQLANEGTVEAITSYSTNIIQRDPKSQALSSVSVQYMTEEDKNEDYNRADRGRSRKVYRIKNPFQQREEDETRQQQDSQTGPQDTDSGASNQYTAMQYSLPPEEFLRQMRAENQYYQQQQQVSTPAPNLGYTATPQPQYQYSTVAPTSYDNTASNNQIPQQDPKMQQDYRSFSNSYQYNGPNSYIENVQSTPSPLPPYLSTSNNQYIGTPSSTYVSSSSPLYLSSPANIQFVSSSISAIPAGTPDYNNKVTSTIGSNSLSYEMDMNKKMQIDHYDNSATGIRYPTSIQQQLNDYHSSTPAPASTPYPDPVRDAWQNNVNSNTNALSKSMEEYSQYQKYSYNQKQDTRSDQIDGDTHRLGNMPAANNVYLNYAQPDYQGLSNTRSRSRDTEQETGRTEVYSHGDYGWKLNERKPYVSQSQSQPEYVASSNNPRYQALSSHNDGVAVSQMSFHMDTSKPQQNYNHISKSSTDETDAQEFAKAAAKAHENMKRQQFYANEYQSSYNSYNPVGTSTVGNSFYDSVDDRQRSKMYSNSHTPRPYVYGNSQPDLITSSPYYFANARENIEEKPKLPFDHDRALKNIVPIDVSNVVQETQQKLPSGLDNTRFGIHNFGKDQAEQNFKQNLRTITDQFYQDKNAAYGLNIKPKPDDGISSDSLKFLEQNSPYFTKPTPQPPFYNQVYPENKRYIDSSSSSANYVPQQSNSYSESVVSPANIQQHGLQRPQGPTDITSILKLNDIPYRLTQNLPTETYRMNSGNYEPVGLPTPLPIRLNQNVGSHNIDAASSILNKLMLNNKPTSFRPEIDPSVLSTINGFKVANPYNVDLKLVADMLKGKQAPDDSLALRDQYLKPSPLKFDLSQLQQLLLKNDNPGGLVQVDGIGAYSSPYLDIYGSGRYPYTGVKYSRSQEEEETVIPIADASNNHPIGAVIEQDDTMNAREVSTGTDITDQEEEGATPLKLNEDRQKHSFGPGRRPSRHRHPNSIPPGRHGMPRKYPRGEPHSLLKPPSNHRSRSRNVHRPEKYHSNNWRRRPKRPKVLRAVKSEPAYESEPDDNSDGVSFLLRPPSPDAEAKADFNQDQTTEPETSS